MQFYPSHLWQINFFNILSSIQGVYVKNLALPYVFTFCLIIGLNAKSSANSSESNAELMQQWISLESQKGKLQTDWREQRQQIEQSLLLFELEQQALQKIIQKSSDVTSEVDERRLSLLSQQTTLENEQQKVSQQLHNLSQNMQHILLRLPPPLQTQWQQKITFISQDSANNSENLERLLSLFKLADDFDKRIAINHTSMLINDKQGKPQKMMVTQIFMGLSQGWYVNEDGSMFGYGKATSLGWQWWHQQAAQNELGLSLNPDVLLKIRAALDNPTTATYLSLPVKISMDLTNES
jgi:hypothetical protein